MKPVEVIHVVKVVVALVFLVEASRKDLKERLISNKLWVYMLVVFIPLDALEYLVKPFNLIFAVL